MKQIIPELAASSTPKFKVLDIFSGIGGMSLGLERTNGFETVAFCEIDPFCRRVLAKHWPGVPIHADVRTRQFVPGEADVLTAGFPCQDASSAGNRTERTGIAGERTGLFREVVRALRLVRPKFAILENVAALLARGMGSVLGALAESRYDAEWDCVPAAAVGAPHLRDRLVVVAYPCGSGIGPQRDILSQIDLNPPRRRHPSGLDLADRGPWSTMPDVRRVDYGLPGTMDRLAALGNAFVPEIPKRVGQRILEAAA